MATTTANTTTADVLDALGIDPKENDYVKPSVVEMAATRLYNDAQSGTTTDTQELYDEAVKLDSKVKDMDLRQFHARVLLAPKRRLSSLDNGNGGKKTASKSKSKKTTTTRKSSASSTPASTSSASASSTASSSSDDTSRLTSEQQIENVLFEMCYEVFTASKDHASAGDFARYIGENINAYRDRVLTICNS